jgi:hypothetical protein
MSDEEERAYISESLERFQRATKRDPSGWLGPERYESERTPQLLDAAGIDYVCDWSNDEQPYLMNTPRRLVSLPSAYALDDAVMLVSRGFPVESYLETVRQEFARLAIDGAVSARSLVLVVRPWLVGHAYRIGEFERVLGTIVDDPRCWPASTGQIVQAFRLVNG